MIQFIHKERQKKTENYRISADKTVSISFGLYKLSPSVWYFEQQYENRTQRRVEYRKFRLNGPYGTERLRLNQTW